MISLDPSIFIFLFSIALFIIDANLGLFLFLFLIFYTLAIYYIEFETFSLYFNNKLLGFSGKFFKVMVYLVNFYGIIIFLLFYYFSGSVKATFF